MYNLRPLNLPTYYLSILHIHTPPLFQVLLEEDGWLVDMLWCQNIGLS